MKYRQLEYLKFCFGGIIAALSFPPFFIFPCFFLSFGWLFFKLFINNYSVKNLSLKILYYWSSFFVFNLYWLVIPLSFDLKQYLILMPVALLFVPLFLSLYFLPAIYLTKKYGKTIYSAGIIYILSNFFMIYICGQWFPAFPWLLPGYIWNFSDIAIQPLCLWGIYGQTFITLLIGTFIGIIMYQYKLKKKYCPLLLIISLIFIILFSFGYYRLYKNPTFFTHYTARIVKLNTGQKERMDKELRFQHLESYLEYSKHLNTTFNLNNNKYENQGHLDFIIWSEASVPYLFHDNFQYLKEKLSSKLFPEEYLITGVVRKDNVTGKIYNSVVIIDNNSNVVNRYDKRHLVPFGEYIPLREYIPKNFQAVANSIGDFDVGNKPNIVKLKNIKIILAICYEAIFTSEFMPKSEDGDVIINITNDSWFGYSNALIQHLQIVRTRAVEEGLPLIRATGFGIASVFDAYGREIYSLKSNESGVIDFYIPQKANQTIFSYIRKFF